MKTTKMLLITLVVLLALMIISACSPYRKAHSGPKFPGANYAKKEKFYKW